jgi:hypothetical protein
MHPAFRAGFEKTAQSPEEDAYARGVIAGYNNAKQEMEMPQEQADPAGQPPTGGESPVGGVGGPQPPGTSADSGMPPAVGPSLLSSTAARNPMTQAGQSGMPYDAIQTQPTQPSPPPEKRNPDLSPQAATNGQRGAQPNKRVAPIPQRAQRDYGEQFSGAQTPYSSMY